MQRSSFVVAALVVLIAMPALAQTQPPATTRVAGTVAKLDGNTLTVTIPDGKTVTVALNDDAVVFGVEKRAIGDVKPGDYLASGGIKGTDGKIHAVEVRIFPEVLRGTGEGQRAWSAKPDGVMTNATVGTVSHSPEGGVIHVKFKDGESDFIVAQDVPVLAYVAGDRGLLTPGAAVFTVARQQPDGTLTTGRVTAEKNGVKPPM